MELARAVHRPIHDRVSLEPLECGGYLGRPWDAADVAPVEDQTRLDVLGIVVGAGRLVLVERRPHVLRQRIAQLACLAREVRPRRCGVREYERSQPRRLRERVFLREKATPGLTENVMPLADAERVDEVV